MNYERDLTSKDRSRFIVRHEISRYDIPNEQLQQAAGQRQNRGQRRDHGHRFIRAYFFVHAVVDFRAMARDNANDFNSNQLPHQSKSSSTIGFAKRILKAQQRSIGGVTSGSLGLNQITRI